MTIKREQVILIAINFIGGIAVLGSYVYGIVTNPESAGALWGDVPAALMQFYTPSMFTAAAGYLAFTWFIVFRLAPGTTRIAGRFSYGLFGPLYALVLVPSALWMPLTFAMIQAPSVALWVAVRGVLSLAGLGSLGMLVSLITLESPAGPLERRIAIGGCVFFCIQTVVLDAIVWTAYFPTNF